MTSDADFWSRGEKILAERVREVGSNIAGVMAPNGFLLVGFGPVGMHYVSNAPREHVERLLRELLKKIESEPNV